MIEQRLFKASHPRNVILSRGQGFMMELHKGGGKKLRITLGEGNSDTNSPDVGSNDISSNMKHRTVDG
jgi:hypothetical protein